MDGFGHKVLEQREAELEPIAWQYLIGVSRVEPTVVIPVSMAGLVGITFSPCVNESTTTM